MTMSARVRGRKKSPKVRHFNKNLISDTVCPAPTYTFSNVDSPYSYFEEWNPDYASAVRHVKGNDHYILPCKSGFATSKDFTVRSVAGKCGAGNAVGTVADPVCVDSKFGFILAHSWARGLSERLIIP